MNSTEHEALVGKKERGRLINILLALEIFVQSIPLQQYIVLDLQRNLIQQFNLQKSISHSLPTFADIGFGLGTIIFAIAVFKWKRWGIVGLGAILIVELLVNLLVYKGLHGGAFQAPITLTILLLLRSKWHYFN